MDRKEFIKSCGVVCIGASGLATLLQSCGATNYFAKTSEFNSAESNKIVIKKTEFVYTDKAETKLRKYVLVKTNKSEFPIFLYKHSEEEYSALLMYCTHNGCELKPQGEFLICPCHGSEFTSKGKVLNPPSDQDLQQFKTSVDNENIYIQL